jgi:putative membrane protein insertion efficiency factor
MSPSFLSRFLRASAATPARLLLLALRLYQRTVSPLLPVVTLGACGCRFSPTCSHYAAEAIRTHGALAGTGLALARLGRCTPLHPGGFDPVPERATRRPAPPTCHAVRG